MAYDSRKLKTTDMERLINEYLSALISRVINIARLASMTFHNHINERRILGPFFSRIPEPQSRRFCSGDQALEKTLTRSVPEAVRVLVKYQVIVDGTTMTLR